MTATGRLTRQPMLTVVVVRPLVYHFGWGKVGERIWVAGGAGLGCLSLLC